MHDKAEIAKTSTGIKQSERIKKRHEFNKIQRFGTRAKGKFLVLIATSKKYGTCGKVGITISKKVGNAPTRNLLKRRIRHILGENKGVFSTINLVVLVLPNAAKIEFSTLKDELLILADKVLKKRQAYKFGKKAQHAKSI